MSSSCVSPAVRKRTRLCSRIIKNLTLPRLGVVPCRKVSTQLTTEHEPSPATMPRESRKKVSYVEPDDDDDDLVASSPEKPTKKRLVKSKDVAAAEEGAMSLAGTAKAGSKGPKQLKNGLWVQDEEESRELLPSVDHSEALRHPFPVLVAPERLAVDAAAEEERAAKAASAKIARPAAKKAQGSGGGLQRFAFKTQQGTSEDESEAVASADSADDDMDENDENEPPKRAAAGTKKKSGSGKQAVAAKKKTRHSRASKVSEEVRRSADSNCPDRASRR